MPVFNCMTVDYQEAVLCVAVHLCALSLNASNSRMDGHMKY